MPTIVLANPKGGCGKSTTALILGQILAREVPTAIIDADPNQPISTWAAAGCSPDNLMVIRNQSVETLLDEIDEASDTHKFVIVDLEGVASRALSYAVTRAHLTIIPMQKSRPDADMAGKAIRAIRIEEKARRARIPFAIAFTKTRVVAESKTAQRIATDVRSTGLDIVGVELHQRDAFAAIFDLGCTLFALDPKRVNNIDAAINNAEMFTGDLVTRFMKTVRSAAA